jgi:uncharacterized membrane protein
MAVASLAAVLASHPAAFGQCSYSVQVIQGPNCPFAGQAALIGRGLNSHGDVVGFWTECGSTIDHAFHWSAKTGVLTTLPRPPDVWTARAFDINDAGLIIGTHSITGLGNRGFVYDINNADAGFTYLEPLHGVGGSVLRAINNMGLAVGERSIHKPGQPSSYNAVIWNTKTGEVVDLGVMSGPNSTASDGNGGNDAAGWSGSSQISLDARATLWADGKGQDLGVLPGCLQSTAGKVNSSRVVTGSSRQGDCGAFTPYLWQDGEMMPFPVPTCYEWAGATDLNDVAQFIGRMQLKGSPEVHPFLMQHGVFRHLLELVVDVPSNLVIEGGVRIGNDGRILARGTLNGNALAVLLTPVDQPSTDLNHDCRTDHHDLLILLSQWGPVPLGASGGVPIADFNGDGVVDVLDLLILLDNWDHTKGGGPAK